MKHLVFLILAAVSPVFFHIQAQTAPGQPKEGPGGSTYAYDSVRVTKFGNNELDKTFWLYEPLPKPSKGTRLPVVVFWHGTSSQTDPDRVPDGQRLFCEHIARKGYLVVFPLYQYGGNTLAFSPQLQAGVSTIYEAFRTLLDTSATDELGAPLIEPLTDGAGKVRFANAGISRGGGMSINTSAFLFSYLSIPNIELANYPDAICSIVPGSGRNQFQIPSSTKYLLISAEEDAVNGPLSPGGNSHLQAWSGMEHIPCANKNYILARSDRRGTPHLIADHDFSGSGSNPENQERLNALDFYGSWKWAVGLLNCTFYNQDCSYALGSSDSITFMGSWSDGTPVQPAALLSNCGNATSARATLLRPFKVRLFPTPATDLMYLEFQEPLEQRVRIRISHSSGRQISQFWIDPQEKLTQIDVSQLPAGMYVLQLADGNRTWGLTFLVH